MEGREVWREWPELNTVGMVTWAKTRDKHAVAMQYKAPNVDSVIDNYLRQELAQYEYTSYLK